MTPWTVAHQAPLSMRFSRQGYWSGFPFPSPGNLPNPGIESASPALQADSLPNSTICVNPKVQVKFHILLSLFISEIIDEAAHVKDNKINSAPI